MRETLVYLWERALPHSTAVCSCGSVHVCGTQPHMQAHNTICTRAGSGAPMNGCHPSHARLPCVRCVCVCVCMLTPTVTDNQTHTVCNGRPLRA